jgi:hypothetical protein
MYRLINCFGIKQKSSLIYSQVDHNIETLRVSIPCKIKSLVGEDVEEGDDGGDSGEVDDQDTRGMSLEPGNLNSTYTIGEKSTEIMFVSF